MLYLLLIGVLSFGLTIVSSHQLGKIPSRAESPVYVAPPKYLQHLIFGYNESTADSLWLRTVQDFDTCQNQVEQDELKIVKAVEKPEGITDKKMNFLFDLVAKANKDRKVCRMGWVFRMLDATTEIAPDFKMPYEAGALSLSVLIDDYEGAGYLFDKAVKRFPDDWKILYGAAYHYLFDQKDMDKAAKLLVKAGDAGAPSWVKSLAATIYTTQGQLHLAVSNLESLKAGVDDVQKKYLDRRIQELKEQARLLESQPQK